MSDANYVNSIDSGGTMFTVSRYAGERGSIGDYEELYFETSVSGRYFLIIAQSWHQWISMRAGFMICGE